MNAGRVMTLWCMAPRLDPDHPPVECNRARNHVMPHRGAEHGTGRLVSWSDPAGPDETLELAEHWSDDPDGWSSYSGTLVGGPWAVIAAMTPYAILSACIVAVACVPALLVLLWRAAL